MQHWERRVRAAYAASLPSIPEGQGLTCAVAPLAERARLQVRAAVASAPSPFGGQAARVSTTLSLEAGLIHRLEQAASKVLVLELGVAAAGELLAGDTPKERFSFFCECLRDRAFAAELLLRYPALAQRLMRIIAHWRNASRELLQRLCQDWPIIRDEIFSGRDVGELMNIAALGDAHAGGRTVHRLTFSGGEALIYKPRSVAMERQVFRFIAWANTRGLEPDLKAPRTVDRDAYGWVSNLAPSPCEDLGAVERFFRRQGANLALTYILGATDMHFENVLAVGEYPVIVDWETLFQAQPSHKGAGASVLALNLIQDSVARTLMLPIRIYGGHRDDGGRRSADISALGYVDAQDSPFPAIAMDKVGTDAMRLRHFYGRMPPGACLPLLNGDRVPASGFQDEIEAGFVSAYVFFQRRKRALLGPCGPLAAFKNQTMRHVFRPTAQYAQLLADSWHPRLAQDSRLLRTFLRTGLNALDVLAGPITASEVRSLIEGDIPYFVARVGGRRADAPASGQRNIRTPGDGWRATIQRVRRLNSVDLARQVWLARVSFANTAAAPGPNGAPPRLATRREMVERATALGDQLCAGAIDRDDRAAWLYPTMDHDRQWSPACTGLDLYQGHAGIALFLGRLSMATRSRRFLGTMEASIQEALRLHKADPQRASSIGAYDGSAGLAYALALLGRWRDRSDWLARARAIVRDQLRHANSEGGLDLIGGSAGLLIVATALADIADESRLLAEARPVALSLRAASAERLPTGVDCGLAHGRAGLGYALARWANAVGDSATLAVGRKWLSADVRAAERARARKSAGGAAMLAWCRGGLGAAWALMSLGLTNKPATNVVRDLLSDERVRGTGPLCPCHGLLGVVEFLIDARTHEVPGASQLLRKLKGEALGRLFSGETCSDFAHRLETPGLLLGLAGSGYSLLRLADHENTPSILMI